MRAYGCRRLFTCKASRCAFLIFIFILATSAAISQAADRRDRGDPHLSAPGNTGDHGHSAEQITLKESITNGQAETKAHATSRESEFTASSGEHVTEPAGGNAGYNGYHQDGVSTAKEEYMRRIISEQAEQAGSSPLPSEHIKSEILGTISKLVQGNKEDHSSAKEELLSKIKDLVKADEAVKDELMRKLAKMTKGGEKIVLTTIDVSNAPGDSADSVIDAVKRAAKVIAEESITLTISEDGIHSIDISDDDMLDPSADEKPVYSEEDLQVVDVIQRLKDNSYQSDSDLQELESFANSGNKFAKTALATYLLSHVSTTAEEDEHIVSLLLDASSQGFPAAQRMLAMMYLAHIAVPPLNLSTSTPVAEGTPSFVSSSAPTSIPSSPASASVSSSSPVFPSLASNLGAEIDNITRHAVSLVRSAAQGGDFIATAMLGYWHLYGLYTQTRSCEKAWRWYEGAAAIAIEQLVETGVDPSLQPVTLSEAFDYGEPLADSGEEANAVLYYQNLANDLHDPEAAAVLGEVYFFGHPAGGIDPNPALAAEYFHQAAQGGHAQSQANLGLLYSKGVGVDENITEAVRYFNMSARQGNTLGQTGLAYLYFHGTGVAQNISEAVRLWEGAASAGSVEAHNSLGVLYLNGQGVSANKTKAYEHFIVAAEAGSAQAMVNTAVLEKQGMGTCETAVSRIKSVAERSELIRQLPFSHHHSQILYQEGQYSLSLRGYALSAMYGSVAGIRNAAFLFYNGLGLEHYRLQQNFSTSSIAPEEEYSTWGKRMALNLYNLGVHQKIGEAYRQVGHCYHTGWDGLCATNSTRALEFYMLSAGEHDAHAMFTSAWMLFSGSEVQPNTTMAKELLSNCTFEGFPRSAPCYAMLAVVETSEILDVCAHAIVSFLGNFSVDSFLDSVIVLFSLVGTALLSILFSTSYLRRRGVGGNIN